MSDRLGARVWYFLRLALIDSAARLGRTKLAVAAGRDRAAQWGVTVREASSRRDKRAFRRHKMVHT